MSDRIMQRLAGGGRTGVFLGAIAAVLIALFLPGWAGAILLTVIVAGTGLADGEDLGRARRQAGVPSDF